MYRLVRLFTILFILVYAQNLSVAEQLDDLKERSMKLRNTDSKVRREVEWRTIASSFAVLSDNKKLPVGARAVALYNAAKLQCEIGRARNIAEDSELCRDYLKELLRKYPESSYADDSIKDIAESFEVAGDAGDAEDMWQQLLVQFPESEFASLAKSHLGIEIDNHSVSNISLEEAVVILDAGHGGEDFGAVGPGNLNEKDVTLAVAKRAAELLAREGIPTALTRTEDEFVPLEKRTDISNRSKAKVFVSLHCNASPKGTLSGLETYYVDNTDDQAAKKLAERENTSAGAPSTLDMILSDLVQQAKTPDSIKLAHLVSESTYHETKSFRVGPNRGVKKAPFYVLVGPHIPAILLEMYFVNHPTEGQLLGEHSFRNSLAQGVVDGIRRYLEVSR